VARWWWHPTRPHTDSISHEEHEEDSHEEHEETTVRFLLRDTIALDCVFLTNTASAIVSLETQDLDHSAALVAAIGRAVIFVAFVAW
jgi:hypothetical protein